MKVYCDSSVHEACWVVWSEDPKPEIVRYPNRVTTNVGEYSALLLTLEQLERVGTYLEPVTIFSDSQLIVNQVSGLWRCRDARLLPLRDRARDLCQRLPAQLTWIPREENLAGIVLEGRTELYK